MPDATAVSETTPRTGRTSAAISNAIVGVIRDHTGRGPTHVRTTLGSDTIIVTLRESLTKAERTLAAHGRHLEVLALRRALQHEMRTDLIAAVETLTGRTVEALLMDNLHDPDVAVEVFLMTAAA